MKYCPAFPQRFASIGEAGRFCQVFFTYYNNDHRHSGIGLHTPATVHDGTAVEIRAERGKVLTAAYTANPTRFGRPPTPPRLPTLDQRTSEGEPQHRIRSLNGLTGFDRGFRTQVVAEERV
ncbi:hypothetical protein [Nocardia sp. NPDC049707]|uniref:hypothetical protein n=1 Tax=Nocardia sp. NPDC049707 TaxID=3154735 RepID=UPI00344AD4C6